MLPRYQVLVFFSPFLPSSFTFFVSSLLTSLIFAEEKVADAEMVMTGAGEGGKVE